MDPINGTPDYTYQESIERSMNYLVRAVLRTQNLMDVYTDHGMEIPSDVSSDYEECVRRASAYADRWGFVLDLDC